MLKFNKVYNLRFISIFIAVSFVLNSTVYGIDLSNKSLLRVPSSCQEYRERLGEALLELSNEGVGEVIRKGLPREICILFPDGADDDDKERIRKERRKKIEDFPKVDGSVFGLEGTFTLIPVTNLLRRTGDMAHIGLSDSYGEIVIYMDEELYESRREKQSLNGRAASTANNHELRTIALYMEAINKRTLNSTPIGVDLSGVTSLADLRGWMRRNPSDAYQLNERIHNLANETETCDIRPFYRDRRFTERIDQASLQELREKFPLWQEGDAVPAKYTPSVAAGDYGNEYAERYLRSTAYNLYTTYKNILLAAEIARVSPGNVVDLGSNVNPISRFGLLARLRARGFPIDAPFIGLDSDRSYFDVERHSRTFPGRIYSREEAGQGIVGDIRQIPLAAESAACIVCADVLEHLSNPRMAIREIFRILTYGGRAFIIVPTFYKLDEFNYEHIRQKRPTSHLRFFKEELVFDLLREMGFRIEKAYGFGYMTAFPYLLWLNEDYVPQNGVGTEKEGVCRQILKILRDNLSMRDCMLIDENIRNCDNLLENDYIDLSEEVSRDIRHLLYLCCEVLKFHPDYSARADLQTVYVKVRGIVDQALDDFSDPVIARRLEILKGRFEDASFVTYYAGNALLIQALKSSSLGFQRSRDPYPQNPHLLRLFVDRYNDRSVFVRRKGEEDSIVPDEFSGRYSFKYPKVLALLEYADIGEGDVVLDPFSGTGGFLIAASFRKPRLLIGSDIAYEPGVLIEDIQYAPESNFVAWEQICTSYFNALGQTVPSYTRPVFVYGDATNLSSIVDRYGKRAVTRIASSPPTGRATFEISSMDEEASYCLFVTHINRLYESELLAIDGKAYYIIPYPWVDRLFEEGLPYEIEVMEHQVEGETLSIVCLKEETLDAVKGELVDVPTKKAVSRKSDVIVRSASSVRQVGRSKFAGWLENLDSDTAVVIVARNAEEYREVEYLEYDKRVYIQLVDGEGVDSLGLDDRILNINEGQIGALFGFLEDERYTDGIRLDVLPEQIAEEIWKGV